VGLAVAVDLHQDGIEGYGSVDLSPPYKRYASRAQ